MSEINVGNFVKHLNCNEEMKVVGKTSDWITCEWEAEDGSRIVKDFRPNVLVFVGSKPPLNIKPSVLKYFQQNLSKS